MTMHNPLIDPVNAVRRVSCAKWSTSLEESQCLKRWQDELCGDCTVGLFLHQRMVAIPSAEEEDTPMARRSKMMRKHPAIGWCEICGNEYDRGRSHTMTCSPECNRELHRIRRMEWV
jgi:hypothetical protein